MEKIDLDNFYILYGTASFDDPNYLMTREVTRRSDSLGRELLVFLNEEIKREMKIGATR
jgi:hypothetical protein